MIYALVRELAADGVPVAVTCRVLRLSTSGFYDWWHRPLTERQTAVAVLTRVLRRSAR